MYVMFTDSTLPLYWTPYAETYGTPQSMLFPLTTAVVVGEQGTFTVTGRAGNVERTAQVTVNISKCRPLPPDQACGGAVCGVAGDNCGSLESCGNCSGMTPYCYEGECISQKPVACIPGKGFDTEGGGCISCPDSPACTGCAALGGHCISVKSQCLCYTQPGGIPATPWDSGG